MIGAITSTLGERWDELRLPGDRPKRLLVHLDPADPREHGFVVFRVFRSGDPHPLCRGRIPRDGLGTREALHDHGLLTALHDEAARAVHRLVPRPLFAIERGARVATARTILAGEPAPAALARIPLRAERLDAALGWGARWLAAFARVTGLLEGTEGALWEPLLRSVHFERARLDADAHPAVDALAAAIGERRREVRLCGFGHGALTVTSLRVAGDRIGVVDWEHGRTRQAPWVDPVAFALDLAIRELPTPSAAVRVLRDPEHALGAFVRNAFDDTGIPEEILDLAVPAVALAAAHRIERNGPSFPPADAWREAGLAALDAAVPARNHGVRSIPAPSVRITPS